MRILVTPEQLRETARLLQQAQAEWQRQNSLLQGRISSLDWESRQKMDIEGKMQQVNRLASDLAQHASELAIYLNNAAGRFEQADQASLAGISLSIGGAVASWLHSIAALTTGLPTTNAAYASWSRISQIMGAPLSGNVILPVSGGNALAGLATLASVPVLGSTMAPLIESVWNWLHGYGWRTNSELESSASSRSATGSSSSESGASSAGTEKQGSAPETTPKTTFGDLLKTPIDDQAPAASPAAQTSPSVAVTVTVPNISQQGLQYKGENTQYGCTAASTSMVLEYWHAKDSSAGTMSAQAILDANVKQGTFTGTGLSATDVHDEVSSLGYKTVQDHVNADFSALKQDVQQGPVLAVVKLGIQKSGYNHAVVVTGISEDGHVTINDPWDGQTHTYTSEKFQSSWGANYGGDMKNIYTVIRP